MKSRSTSMRARARDDAPERDARASRDAASSDARAAKTHHPSIARRIAREGGRIAREFGRHAQYAGTTQSRPLMRGYVHVLSLVIAMIGVLAGYHRALHARVVAFLACTLLTYACSAALHAWPWKTRFGYDAALAVDFIGISWGFTSHTVMWSGGLKTYSAIGAAATFACVCALQIAAFARRSETVAVISFMRGPRLSLIGLNIVFLAVIETTAIEDFKLMLLVQVLSKIVAPAYFLACTRYDAKHKAWLEIPGVWGPHENWHALILVVHLLQLKALLDQTR